MKEKLKKVGKYVKDHKKEIIIGTIVTVGGVVVGKFAWDHRRIVNKTDLVNQLGGYTHHDMPFDVGYSEGYSSKGDWIGTTFNDLRVGDLGKVGSEMLKIPGITEESTISAIIQNENL